MEKLAFKPESQKMRVFISLPFALFLLLLLSGVFGCDPGGPGASGTISLGAGIDHSKFATLAIRIFPDARADFDPAAPLPAASGGGPQARDEPLSALQFPYRYQLGEPLGTTPDRDWRLVAWLSRATGNVPAIAPGDVFCTVRFQIAGCGLFVGGYCGNTDGTDCTLDKVRR